MNLNQAIGITARRFGTKTAIIHNGQEISFSELDTMVLDFASALDAKGILKGDRVALYLNNSIEFIVAYLGTLRLGAIAVLLDPKYKQAELTALLKDCRPRAMVTDRACLNSMHSNPPFRTIEFMVSAGEPCEGSISFTEFVSSGKLINDLPELDDKDAAHIAYTSGPSLTPKGVVAQYGNLVTEIKLSVQSFKQTDKDVVLQFALPMHHVIGLVVVMLGALYSGSRLVILDGVSMESLTSTIQHQRVTMFMGVPFIHAMLLRKIKDEGIKHDLSSLRVTGSAGDVLPYPIVDGYRRLLGRKLINFYGLTETLGHVTCEPLIGKDIPGNVGPALPGWHIRVVDPDGKAVPPGNQGEVIISGPMMKGYYRKPLVNKEVLKRGWLHTGDLGKFDDENNLHIVGLQKDMLICKGQNIFPSDIEHILSQHPAVQSVAVVGVPDEMRGEVVGAAVVFKPSAHAAEAALTKYCLERLANYKAPKYFLFMNQLTLDNHGKVDKNKLRAEFINNLGALLREE